MAASVALYTRSGRERPADFVPVASVSLPSIDQAPSAGASGATPSPPSSAMAERAARPTGGVEVNEIDAPARGVSVFEIPLGAAGAAANSAAALRLVERRHLGRRRPGGVRMTRRRALTVVAALAAGFASMTGTAAVAGADSAGAASKSAPTVEISVIYAGRSDAGGSIDPSLRDLPQLTRDQPFVRYNVYKLLERREHPFEVGKPAAYPLANGRALQLTLVDMETTPLPHAERRYHVRAAIGEPGKQAFLKLLEVTASEGEPFFVGGQSYQGGTLLLELVVR